MAHVGEKLILGPARGLGFFLGLAEISHQNIVGKPHLQTGNKGILHTGCRFDQHQGVQNDNAGHDVIKLAAVLQEQIGKGQQGGAHVEKIQIA